jgi:hypothetical protein
VLSAQLEASGFGVAAKTDQDLRVATVNLALSEWRQGDSVLGEQWFVHRLDKSFAVTDAGRAAAEEDADLAEQQVPGLVVVTQTCDVVRSCTERPYVEVCPLVVVDGERLRQIEKGRRPAYGFLPALALARERIRFAFPDDFTSLVRKLQRRLEEKHDRDSVEGRALRALDEIRVSAAKCWADEPCEITFLFLRNENDVDFEGKSWSVLLDSWLNLVPRSGRFTKICGQVTTLSDLSAADYVDSDPLDLDHLSTGSG